MPEANPDAADSGIRIRWEVPLPWLISGMALICAQAAVVYFGQVRQGELQQSQSIAIKEMTKEMRDLNSLITSNNVKDVEHDLKLADHDRRIQAVEVRAMRNLTH